MPWIPCDRLCTHASELPCFVAGCCQDTLADSEGLADERRVIQLLDRSVKGVTVDDDDALREVPLGFELCDELVRSLLLWCQIATAALDGIFDNLEGALDLGCELFVFALLVLEVIAAFALRERGSRIPWSGLIGRVEHTSPDTHRLVDNGSDLIRAAESVLGQGNQSVSHPTHSRFSPALPVDGPASRCSRLSVGSISASFLLLEGLNAAIASSATPPSSCASMALSLPFAVLLLPCAAVVFAGAHSDARPRPRPDVLAPLLEAAAELPLAGRWRWLSSSRDSSSLPPSRRNTIVYSGVHHPAVSE